MKLADRYIIDRHVGAGGGGGVFLVRDRLADNAPMVLKRLHAQAQAGVAQWLVNEFQVLAQLDLPAVARVYDFGLAEADAEDPGGPFFTREFIDGTPLDRALQNTAPVATHLAEIFSVSAEALRAMHRLGVVHGDLKPANMVVPADGRARAPVVLIDFGLAHGALGAAEHVRGGTIAFMPPERREKLFTGEALAPDPRADLYALAASLLVCLGIEQHDSPTPLSISADPALAALATMARQGASPDPDHRFRTCDDFLAALQSAVPQSKIHSFTPSRVILRPEGREAELGQLLEHIAKRLVRKSGGDSVLLVEGEEGSGKTTLLRELTWRAQLRGVQVVHVQGEAGEAPANRIALGAEVLSGRTLTDRSADSIAAAFRLALASAPVLVIADDIDRADPSVHELLRSIAFTFDTQEPFVLLASTSSAGLTEKLSATAAVTLGPLDESAVSSLCAQILGPTEPGVVTAVRSRTGSLPLAVSEMLRALADSGAVTADDVARAEILPKAQELAQRRAKGLPTAVQLSVAAVFALGGTATFTQLAQMGIESEAITYARALGALEVKANTTLSPANPTLAQAVIESLEPSHRESLFATAVTVLRNAQPVQHGLLAHAELRANLLTDALSSTRIAAKELRRANMPYAAAQLLRTMRTRAPELLTSADVLEEAELSRAAGEMTPAVDAAAIAAKSEDRTVAQKARQILCYALGHLGKLSEARAIGELGLAEARSPDERAEFSHELARADILSGEYAACSARCQAALTEEMSEYNRAKLSAQAGLAASWLGDHQHATALLEAALSLWAQQNNPQEESSTLSYLAIGRDRVGDNEGAKGLYERALERARVAGNTAQMATTRLNLGRVLEQMGDLTGSMEHLIAAEKLSRRAGAARVSIGAQLNLAHHLLKLGSYERAIQSLESARSLSHSLGLRALVAHALQGIAVAQARLQRFDQALKTAAQAQQEFIAISDEEATADARLDIAETLLERNATGDRELAQESLEQAKATVTERSDIVMTSRWKWLSARIALAQNDNRVATKLLNDAIDGAEKAGQWELRANALATRAQLHLSTGAELHAKRDRDRAVEVLESVSSILPPDLRSAFWSVPSRVLLRNGDAAPSIQLQKQSDSPLTMSALSQGLTSHGATISAQDRRLVLLIDLSRRVNEERTLDGVLELAARSAAELTMAERAVLLLTEGNGALTMRAMVGPVSDGTEMFSRSIAESALIDGEVLASHNAQGDRRFSDFQSVHDRAVGAVAAVPIRVRARTLGVLYVENRRRQAQWSSMDVTLLRAFAEQAGVAVERAQLISQLEQRTQELEHAQAEVQSLLAERTAELEDTKHSLARAEEALRTRFAPQGIVATSPVMRKLLTVVERVKDTDVPVVVEGESGTGKELIARALHFSGARSRGPFVVTNCGAIPESLMESELFGHLKGSFTGADRDRKGLIATANKGTLMLDEVGDMPLKMQVELLRVLQDKRVRPIGSEREETVDVRIVAASNKPLKQLVADGRFREDLYYRLSVVTLHVPPLRERAEEIPALASHFLAKIAEDQSLPRKKLSREALARLHRAPWPGNVRQLRHVLESAFVLGEGSTIEAEHLNLDDSRGHDSIAPGPGKPGSPSALRRAAERQKIVDALEQCNWNKVKAATVLNMPRRTLYRRLKEYGLLDE